MAFSPQWNAFLDKPQNWLIYYKCVKLSTFIMTSVVNLEGSAPKESVNSVVCGV